MEMEVRGWAVTDVGKRRSQNEDRFFRDASLGVFAVADGVGGKPGGAEASEIVVDQIESRAGEFRRFIDSRDVPLDGKARDEIFEFLNGALQAINRQVYRQGTPSKFPRGIGSTLDLVVLAPEGAFIMHVGDSRVYLLRNDDIYRVTRDHTYEQTLRQNPRVGEHERESSDYGHVLTRSIGGEPRVKADRLYVDLNPGDRLLMCTDGITSYLAGEDILRFSDDHDDDEIPRRLVDRANELGGEDNSTVVLMSMGPNDDDFLRAPTRPDTFRRVRFLESVDLFANLGFQELLKVLRFVRTRSVSDGDVIISRGDSVDGLYFVMDGQLSVEIDGEELTTLGQGEHFGEFALFGQPVRSADVRAMARSELLYISKANLERLVDEAPDVGTKLLWKMLARTSEIIQQMLDQ